MFKTKTLTTVLCIVLFVRTITAQTINLLVGANSVINGGAGLYLHSSGDIRCDGLINLAQASILSFDATSAAQRITCIAGSGCGNIYNTDNYQVRLGSIHQFNTSGITVEINTIVKAVHFFYSGATEIKEGNYWLTQTSVTPYSNNDNINKFFVTSGHGLLKQSNVSATGTFYPIGSAANADNYTPITINYSGTADTFGVRVFDNTFFSYNPANGAAAGGILNYRSVKKSWIIKKSHRTVGDQFTITPRWNLINEEANFTARRPTDICIARNHDGFWFPEMLQGPAVPPAGAGPFTYTGKVTYDNAPWEYYPTTVTALNIVLPFTGLSLTAAFDAGSNAILKWFTLTEAISSYFEIERSTNGINFYAIAKVAAAGFSNSKQEYAYTDNSVPETATLLFYRLKLTDHNGQYSYSKIQQLSKNVFIHTISVYPNPANHFTEVILPSVASDYSITMYNSSGVLIRKYDENSTGTYAVKIYSADIATGIYFLYIGNKKNGSNTTKTISIIH